MNNLEIKYKDLIGCELQYKSKNMVIREVKIKYDKIIIYTSIRTFVLYEDEAYKLLDELKPIATKELPVVYKASPLKMNMSDYRSNADQITSILMQQMTLISSSDNVMQAQLDKAKSLSQLANTMVNIERIKLEYLNLINK